MRAAHPDSTKASSPSLHVRVDASVTSGLGHLMRTIALAEEADRRGMHVRYFLSGDARATNALTRRRIAMYPVIDIDDQSWLAHVQPGDISVFDGYAFGPKQHAAAGARGATVVAVDDLGQGEFDVDVLVNPNPVGVPDYDIADRALLLLGPRYALVRAEFVERRRQRSGGSGVLTVMVGGSDAKGVTPMLMDSLRSGTANRPFRRVVLIAGPLMDPAVREPGPEWLEVVVDPPSVAEVVDRSDAVLSAAGATAWELLAMGMPCALFVAADNQVGVVATVAATAAALVVGHVDELPRLLPEILATLADAQAQADLSVRALRAVDGAGARRVIDAAEPSRRP